MERRTFLKSVGGAIAAIPFLRIALPAQASPSTRVDTYEYILNEEWRIQFTGWEMNPNRCVLYGQWIGTPIKRGQWDHSRLPHFIEIREYEGASSETLNFVQEFGYHDLMQMLQKYEKDHIPRDWRGKIDHTLLMQEVRAGRLKGIDLLKFAKTSGF